jgi:hypothetical protein
LDSPKKADREQSILRTSPFILEVSAVEKIILPEAFKIGYDKMSNNKVREEMMPMVNLYDMKGSDMVEARPQRHYVAMSGHMGRILELTKNKLLEDVVLVEGVN